MRFELGKIVAILAGRFVTRAKRCVQAIHLTLQMHQRRSMLLELLKCTSYSLRLLLGGASSVLILFLCPQPFLFHGLPLSFFFSCETGCLLFGLTTLNVLFCFSRLFFRLL